MLRRPWLSRRGILSGFAAFVAAAFVTPPAHACGPDTNCEIEGGFYRFQTPDGWDGTSPLGVVVHMHGWQNSAEAAMRLHPRWLRSRCSLCSMG